MAFPIDHLFTVTSDRAAGQAALAKMGFTLTARGEHPGRGTSNHLMFFGRIYWELLAIEQPGPASSLLHKASSLMGCALRTQDIAQDTDRALRLGASVSATETVTRPVRIQEEWRTARFTIAPLTPSVPADIYFFFCQHLTPQYVWPQEPLLHANGAYRMRKVYAVGSRVDEGQSGVAALLGSGGGEEPRIEYLSVQAFRDRFGASLSARTDAPAFLGGVAFEVQELDQCAAYLRGQQIEHWRAGGEIHVTDPAVGHPIVFCQ
jgi:hypothetical protein